MITRLLLTIILVAIISQPARAADAYLAFDFRDIPLTDAIRVLANASHANVVIDSSVRGTVTLQLHHVLPQDAMEILLQSKNLARFKSGPVWYVGTTAQLESTLPLVTRTFAIRYGRAQEIATLLQAQQAGWLSKRGSVSVDVRTNMLIVRDVEANFAGVHRVITSVDKPVRQLLIDARLVSLDHDYAKELGVNYAILPEQGAHAAAKYDAGRYSIAVARLADGSKLDIRLAALENSGHARLISSPTLFTANLQPASIEAGEEIPYQEVSESGGTAVVFKKAVLSLKVTPEVLPAGRVMLHMQINQDRPSDKLVQGVPTISTRQIMTHVTAKNGETIVLGGIYEMNEEKGVRGLPFLSSIPLIGLLFQETQWRHNRRELLIFVTPKVII